MNFTVFLCSISSLSYTNYNIRRRSVKDVDLIKFNQECLCCRRFFNNKGECNGRKTVKIKCLAFKEIRT